MIKVSVTDGNVDRSLKKLKREMSVSQILSKAKSKRFHEKPGVKRKREEMENKRNWQKRNRRNY